ncbi:MAG: GH3 auxin-responsive promoter family protein [Cyanobacteriota bacterium]
MGQLLKETISIKGKSLKKSLDMASKDPYSHQKNLLLNILKNNANTEYGQKHNFFKINSVTDYQKNVPINEFKDLEPYIEKIKNGDKNILTSNMPFMFNLTSSTSAKSKYIPVTKEMQIQTTNLMHQWLYRSLLDHPGFLNSSSFLITSAAVEGETESGIPYGSISGMIYKTLPQILHSSYVVPFAVADIQDYDLKYYIIARLAMETDVSFIATPNPITLIRIAEVGIKYQEEIIHCIQKGILSEKINFNDYEKNINIINQINRLLVPNPNKAEFLRNIIKNNKILLPYLYWPNLQLIGCWLGGSVGFHADKLSEYFGKELPMRDLGYLASEGVCSIPYKDNTPSGILALENNYYEFIHEDQIGLDTPDILLCHELKCGENYNIILTNESGLYRYNIGDIIQVQELYNKSPVIAFIRKNNEMLNITGEKLHVNHLLETFNRIRSRTNIGVSQFRVVPNFSKACYDIYIAIDTAVHIEKLKEVFFPLIDDYLIDINIEYKNKRKSKRLNSPCFHLMKPCWEEHLKSILIQSGRRDIQYKWVVMSPEPIDLDRQYIDCTILTDDDF